MTGRILLCARLGELAPLISGVSRVLTSEAYQEILHSYPAAVLDSMDREVNPLPRPPLLEGADDGEILVRLIPVIGLYGYRVEVVDVLNFDPDANGATWHSRRLVQINGRRSPLQQAKTAAHEAAHVALCALSHALAVPVRVRELQAETFAWVLMRRCGVDSGAFSFPFLAKYGAVRQGAVLRADWALAHALDSVSLIADWAIAQMSAREPSA
jgi:IrrE N-terminal-like domain